MLLVKHTRCRKLQLILCYLKQHIDDVFTAIVRSHVERGVLCHRVLPVVCSVLQQESDQVLVPLLARPACDTQDTPRQVYGDAV